MRLVFDIETDGLLDTVTTLHCICATDIDTNREYSFYGATLKDGLELLENATALIGHNIVGYDLVALKMLYPGFSPKGEILDTLVVSMILYPEIKEQDFMLRSIQQRDGKELFPGSQIGKHSLEAWGHRLGEYKDDFGRLPDGKLDPDRFKIFTWEMLEYCLQDVRVNVKMYERFATRLPNRQTLGLEHAVAKICIKQELFGWPFDVGNAEALWTLLTEQKNHIKERLQARFLGWVEETKTPEYYEIVFDGQSFRSSTKAGVVDEAYLSLKSQGMKVTKKLVTELAKAGPNKTIRRKFNPTSAIHVAKAFEEKYGWKPKEFDKLGNPLINEDILTALEKKIPEAGMILEYQMLQDRCEKLKDGKSGWLKLQKNGRIHGRVIPNGTPTCRARHTTPNVAQVPAVKKPYGKECRQLFTCDPGYVLIGSDASGLELRVLSHYLFPFDGGRYAKIVTEGRSEDGTDIHTLNAESVGITRDEAKTLIYLIIFGGSADKLSESIGIPLKRAKVIVDDFKRGIVGYNQLLQAILTTLNTRGFLVGIDGRKLYCRKPFAALNLLIQSAGAIICKLHMVYVNEMATKEGLDFNQLGWIHDENQYQVKPEHVERFKEILKESIKKTENTLKFNCPLDVNIVVGKNWAETH